MDIPRTGARRYPMSGLLDTKPGGPTIGEDGWRHLQWIGRLENAQRDWSRLMNESRIPHVRDVSLRSSRHPTSSDPYDARAAMVAVLRGNATMRKSLCALLEADYVCFGYDIKACLDGRALGAAARSPPGAQDK